MTTAFRHSLAPYGWSGRRAHKPGSAFPRIALHELPYSARRSSCGTRSSFLYGTGVDLSLDVDPLTGGLNGTTPAVAAPAGGPAYW